VKHYVGSVGSVTSNHHGGDGNSMTVTTLLVTSNSAHGGLFRTIRK